MRRLLVLTLVAAAAVAAAPTAASAATETRTVQGELRFEYGANPNDPGNCSAIVFIRWADVPNTTAATAFYRWRGDEKSKSGAPPFDDHYEWVRNYDVEPGYHWIQIGKGWSDGPTPNDCRESSEKQKKDYDLSAGATRVELTIETPDPPAESAECAAARKTLASRRAAVKKAQARLAAAKTPQQKKTRAAALKTAKARRRKAAARVKQVCGAP